ncbi:hypothetical protein IAQ61_002558 [Plenodomus lingam]|nr:hypothetical protein IAQ61_002558 [Plenodomus lingam]
MSEVQSRPARGRSSAPRGGRSSYGSRGPRKANGDGASSSIDTSADHGELGEMKKRYQSQLSTLKELFPDWSDAELVLALEEADGDLQTTIERISEGAVSQFSEVPKKAKDRSRSKATKENAPPTDRLSGVLGGRSDAPRRGGDSGRGGRGRGTERGRGGLRGGRGGAPSTASASRAAGGSVPTTESTAWDTPHATEEKEEAVPDAITAAAPDAVKPVVEPIVSAAKKTWASMFAAPKPAPAVPKPAAKPAPAQEEPTPAPDEPPAHQVAHEPAVHAEELPIPPIADHVVEDPPMAVEDTSKLTPDKSEEAATPDVSLTPSRDRLTEENVEHLPDESHPPPTETAFSTVASSRDIGSAVATPLNGSNQVPIGRPGIGGFQTTALKATAGTPHRSASFQRRILEQQEAVVMPGNHAVDRAAVQFGSLGLGEPADLDVDEEREEAETRTQPPQHSPVAQPRASLPPVSRQAPPQAEAQQQDAIPTPKPAPGLPNPSQQQQSSHQSPSNPLTSHAMQNQGSQSTQQYSQFGRYGQTGIQSEASAPPQKPYDPFGQQIPHSTHSHSNQYDYPGQQSQASSQPGALSSGPDSYGSHYLTAEQRSQYQQYYGSYGQPIAQSQQEAGAAQQRTGSAFASGPNDSAYSQGQQQSQSRYNDAQNSGHNTPNPTAQQGPGSQAQHMQHGQQGQHAGGYPYNHPYYGSPYYTNYMNQFGGYGQGGGYGSFGKGMYGQPHHYGMSPQASFDQHSASPANAGGFGASSLHERSTGVGGGFSDYNRSASGTVQTPGATAAAGGFGSLPDSFSRPQAFGHQSSYGQQQGGQQGLGDESLKPFGESKNGGPSPSALGAQPGRPGSATQNTPGQSGQGPQHTQQQGFGGYPGHLGGNNQYGGLGGLGHQNSGSHQQQSAYGNYGGFGGQYGGGSYNRGGWGGNYGQH